MGVVYLDSSKVFNTFSHNIPQAGSGSDLVPLHPLALLLRDDGVRNLRSLRMLPAAARLRKIHTHNAQNRIDLKVSWPVESFCELKTRFSESCGQGPLAAHSTMGSTGGLCHPLPPAAAQAMAGPGVVLVLHILLSFLPRGITIIKCSGHVWIEPAPVVPMGGNISINCLSTLRCQRAAYSILLNYTPAAGVLRPVNSTTFQLQLQDLRVPNWIVTCVARCPNSKNKELVCGTQVLAGYPPESPSNLSCAVHEHSEQLACTWDAGKPTHLPTRYALHLRSVQTEEEAVFAVGPALAVPLSALRGGSRYSAWLQASNELGTARSPQHHLDLQRLVIPALPVITGVETTEASLPDTIIHWKKQTRKENVHCEERYRAAGAPAWHVQVWAGGPGPRTHYALDSDTRYEFQVRCQLSPASSPWSAWSSPFLYTTPEAAPAAVPDVWRRLGPAFPNGSHEVTVLIKPLPPRAARGRILGYAVSGQSRGAALALCNASTTACRLLVPPGVRALYVTAYNSKGASGPASVAVTRRLAGDEEFPAPAAVKVRREDQSQVAVTWQRPRHSAKPLLWFILECLSAARYSQEHQFFWKKVPKEDTLAYIQEEAAAGSHINVSVYAVYPDGVSKPCSGQVFPEEQFLDSTYSQISYDDDIGVFWGLGVSVIILSVVFVILMFKRSARKRINTIIMSLMPKWLLEDFPHVENSNVIKSFQEKSEFTCNSFSEPFLDNSDPTITEIEEMLVHEEYTIVDIRKKHSKAVPEKAACLQSSVPASGTATELISDYKPQLSDGNPLGYVAANIYQTQPHTLAPEPETNVFFRDYTSPITYLWNAEGTGQHAFLLEKINLILNNNRSGQSNAFDSTQEEQNTLLENQWENTLSSENAQEQTLVPDELVSCLRTMNEESMDIKICFPQSIGRLFCENLQL
ncbi:interleukin-23 receptor [Rhea pennata]|uniref:interleukin-23 receptor n=1 Tax=Rhea pennata TaxID=8795 RepID=UPI002E2720B5